MRYIDFDGVILDTDKELFSEFINIAEFIKLSEEDKIEYLQSRNWKKILNNSPMINDSIYKLKEINSQKSAILTKVYSTDEAIEKVNFLRKQGIKQNIIFVPYQVRKADVVIARNNILIDDGLFNLIEWQENGGYPMFFDRNENNIDSWYVENTFGFQNVKYIDEFKTTKVRKRTNI